MTLFASLTRLLTPAETPILDVSFVPSDVALYHRTAFDADSSELDEQTWDDMLLPQYSARLARETSIFGQQELHRRLHGGARVDNGAMPRARVLAQDPERLRRLQKTCEGLRRTEREVSETLFGPALPPKPRWTAYIRWLPVAFLLTVVLALVTGVVPLWAVVVGLWMALMAVQVAFHEAADQWVLINLGLQQMLRAHTLLARLDDPMTQPFRADAARGAKLNRAIDTSSLIKMMPGGREYSEWLWLLNIRHYFNSREAVRVDIDLLRRSFRMVAELEADLALARHLLDTPRHCWAERGAGVALTDVVHPLLEQAAPLSFALSQEGVADQTGQTGQTGQKGGGAGPARRGAFISGQNGIGKSTLLRTVGLNLIVARAFGFCYAEAAVSPMLPVYSSMQSEDALEGGESLYIAELRRARELLALAERAPAIFIIDEIFRGTNHLESISAAAAVLHTLCASGLVIVSSHNLVLAPLLADRLTPWCVSGDRARLRLLPGVLSETNGIALLGTRGFDDAISVKAKRVFDWLSDYMAHPGECAGVLG